MNNNNQTNAIEICFTGFRTEKKLKLNDWANDSNFKVRKTVSKRLNYLICGKNGGKEKKKRARENGAKVIHLTKCENLIEWKLFTESLGEL